MNTEALPEAKKQASAEHRAFTFEVESLSDGRCLASIRITGGGAPRAACCETDAEILAFMREAFDFLSQYGAGDGLTAQVELAVARGIQTFLCRMKEVEARVLAERSKAP